MGTFPADYPAGKVGDAIPFNGTNTEVQLGNWFTYQTFTIDMWVNPSATQPSYSNIIDNNHVSNQNWVLQMRGDTANPNDWGWGAHLEAVTFDLTPDTWQHVTVTRSFDGVNYTSRVYVNGVEVGSSSSTSPINYNGSQFLRLGNWGSGGRNFNGLMDEVELFDRALATGDRFDLSRLRRR